MVLMKRSEAPVARRMRYFDDMRSRMLRLLEEPFGLSALGEPVGFTPAVEIEDKDGEILVTAELPGLKREHVEIELENNVLTLKGEKKEEREEKEKEMYLYERSYGAFQRSFTLPVAVKEDQVRAEFHDGVLRIHLPKSEQARGKKIPIG